MSEVIAPQASTEEEIRAQLREATEPHLKSRQADGRGPGGAGASAHTDGEFLHRIFGVKPFHKYIAREARQENSVAEYPQAFLDSIVYTTDRDLELIDALAGEVDYDFREPYPSHDALDRYDQFRGKMIEWIADDEARARRFRAVKGTDHFLHGEPGGGKSTLALSLAMWRMELNNETVIWAETVDESGTNERTEWLPFAPVTTIAVPSNLGASARIVPMDTSVGQFEIDLADLARDVIYYDSVQDLTDQLVPGKFYVVYPDPLHRGCGDVSNFNYFNFNEVAATGPDRPHEPTDADHWWFALIAHRISGDVFPHPTFINIDEAGSVLDRDATRDIHQHYDKIKWFRDKYADARKKGVSFGYEAHSLDEVHQFARQKIRWRITMNGNKPPINRTLPGERECPLNHNLTGDMEPGRAVSWKDPNFAKIRWPKLKSKARVDAEVSIDFERWQEATGAI